jgi:UDP-glucose-4-epimerase GalE
MGMILVTGGAGYVGSHFVRYFSERNKEAGIVVIDDLRRGHKESLPTKTNIFFEECPIGDSDRIDRILAKYPIEAVVHFAASAYVGESQLEPFRYFQNNVMQSLSLFECLEKRKIRKLVFSSTCATYGNPLYLPIDEEHSQKPTNVYGTTKLMIEEALKSLVDSSGWSSVFLRYFNAAGASLDGSIGESHDPETHLIPNILSAAAGLEETILINGTDFETRDGTCVRDYVHVDDLARAHVNALSLLEKQAQPGVTAINLGSAIGATILEVIELCEQVTKRSIAKKFGPRRPGDPPALVANATKAKTLLGWQPDISLRDTIESAWRWQEKRTY